MSAKLDPERLQQFVDAQLEGDEQAQFLRELDDIPGGWREVVLAVAEEQIWQRELGGGRNKEEPVAKPIERTAMQHQWWAVAAVAGVLFALGLVTGYGTWGRKTTSTRVAENRPGAKGETVQSAGSAEAHRKAPGYRMVISRAGEQIELPVFEEREPQLMNAALQTQLAKMGYQYQKRTDVLSGQLPDGRMVYVPIQSVSIDYQGQ